MESTALTLGVLIVESLPGLILIWNRHLSAAARSRRAAPALEAWDIGAYDIGLLLWMVVMGGYILQVLLVTVLSSTSLAVVTRDVVAGVGFQFGMLAAVLGFARLSERGRDYSMPERGFVREGLETFLKVLPAIFLTGIVWSFLAARMGVNLNQQELVALFRKSNSPFLLGTLVTMAVVIAPITEELVFRAGLFRYLRRQPPLSVIFVAVIGCATAFLCFDGLLKISRHATRAGAVEGVWGLAVALGAFLLWLSPTVKRFIARPTPRWLAVLLPAVVFAALHANLASFPQLVVLGIIFSLAYERTGNIAVPMLAHALFNLNTIVLLFAGINS